MRVERRRRVSVRGCIVVERGLCICEESESVEVKGRKAGEMEIYKVAAIELAPDLLILSVNSNVYWTSVEMLWAL